MLRRMLAVSAATGLVLALTTGCSSSGDEDSASTSATPSASSTAAYPDHVTDIKVIAEVFGDGQKVAAVAVAYDSAVDAASLSADDFTIDGYTVTGVHTNDRAALTDTNVAGDYAIVEVFTSKINAAYTAEGGGPSGKGTSSGAPGDGTSDGQSGGSAAGSGGMASGTVSNQLQVSITQSGEVATTGGATVPAWSAAVQTAYQDNINLIVDDFQQLVYTNPDDSSDTLMYNLYVPAGATSGSGKYPLVLFMPDATAAGTDPVKTLTQGLGAVVWASSPSQASNPAYVLAPQYTGSGTNDDANTISLVKQLSTKYNIDPSRIYVTGQSAGTISAISMMIDNPTLFAGAMLVAGQADSAYTDRIDQLAGQHIWMIGSTGDERALPGMTAITKAVEGAGTPVTQGSWSATLTKAEQNAKAAKMADAGTSINFTVLSDVVPDGVTSSAVTEHLNTWRVAYSISAIRDWIFQQTTAGGS